MLTISTGVFTAIDLTDATIRSTLKSGGTPAGFAKEFFVRVNYVGLGRFSVAVGVDAMMGMDLDSNRYARIKSISERLHLLNTKIYYLQADTWLSAETAEKTINEAYALMSKTTQLWYTSMIENRKSLIRIGEYKEGIRLKNEGLNEEIIGLLNGGKLK